MMLKSAAGYKTNTLLRPLACLYGVGVGLRNYLFDRGILRAESYPLPIICVGNILVGGTGKTPHVEYLLRLLMPTYRVAVLSRGYKRSSRGLVVAAIESTARDIGDEPYQIKQKFPEALVVVDGNRCRAMRHIISMNEEERPDLVIMDDGFQHRYVQPSFSILLVDAQRPIWDDKLLPEGRLREPASAMYRADCIIVTKSPDEMSPIDQRIIGRNLALYANQSIFFTRHRYLPLRPVERGSLNEDDIAPLLRGDRVIVLSGIANPRPFIHRLESQFRLAGECLFPDHHNFSREDLQSLNEQYRELAAQSSTPLYVVCTEKDAARLTAQLDLLSSEVRSHLYFQPIEVQFLQGAEEFKRLIRLAARAKPAPLQRLK